MRSMACTYTQTSVPHEMLSSFGAPAMAHPDVNSFMHFFYILIKEREKLALDQELCSYTNSKISESVMWV